MRAVTVAQSDITRPRIDETERRIRPYLRRTPMLTADLADFGPAFQGSAQPLHLKLELLQHSVSFKARGAFANLLTREVPAAGVVSVSCGNHGAEIRSAS